MIGKLVVAIVLKGIFLGCVLAVAWPVKQGIDSGAKYLWDKSKDALTPLKSVMVDKDLLQSASTEE